MASIPGDICQIPEDRRHRDEGSGFSQVTVSWSECPPFMGHGITSAGITECGAGFTVSGQPGRDWALMATLSGSGEIWIDGAWKPWSANQAAVLPSHVFHHYRHRQGTWRLCWVVQRSGEDLPLPSAPTLLPFRSDLLAAAIEGCRQERGTGHGREAQHHWAALVALQMRRCLDAEHDQRLDAVWDAVLADPAQDWTLGDLARLAGCGIEALRLAVHGQTGHSPMAHVTWLRIRRAASQLLLGDERVSAIAAEVGYENPFAFSVAFKRLMGVSPAVYRGQRHGHRLIPGDPLGKPPSRGGLGALPRKRKPPEPS